MKGKWFHHTEIDPEQWDARVESSETAGIFSTSHYLNATCKNWYAYTDSAMTCAIPVGVSRKLGVQQVYPPFFHRFSEIVGDPAAFNEEHFVKSIQQSFPKGVLHSSVPIEGNLQQQKFVYQTLDRDQFKLKNQAKRMLKKFSASELTVASDNNCAKEVLQLIKRELSKKMELYASTDSSALDRLISNLPANIGLKTVVLHEKKEIAGGLLALEYKNTVLYLKGTTTAAAKESGGMYALMHHLIEDALHSDQLFDFGGSRVEGVRFFNTRFNAKDKTYFCYHWDHSPAWYKFLNRMNQWRKK